MAEIKLKIASVVIGSGEGGGSGVAPYYADLPDKPSINGETLAGNMTSEDLGLASAEQSVPSGGTTGQVLAKKSNADNDVQWVNKESGGTDDYADLTNKPQINSVALSGNKSASELGLATAAQGALAASAYQKPQTGIPSTDLASGVQTSLGKADTAVQQVTVGTTTTGAAGSNASVNNSGTSTAPVLDFTIPRGVDGSDAVNPFKGYFNSLSDLQVKYPTGETGDFANVYDSTADKTYRYIWDATLSTPAWVQALDSSSQPIEVTPSTATFATGQSVIDTSIVNDFITGGITNIASAETAKELNAKLYGYFTTEENGEELVGSGKPIDGTPDYSINFNPLAETSDTFIRRGSGKLSYIIPRPSNAIKVAVTGVNNGNQTYICLFKKSPDGLNDGEYTISQLASQDYIPSDATISTVVIWIYKGAEKQVVLPDWCKYVVVCDQSITSSSNRTPTSMYFINSEHIDGDIDEIRDDISDIQLNVESIEQDVSFMKDLLIDDVTKILTESDFSNAKVYPSTSTWVTSQQSNATLYKTVKAGDIIHVVGKTANNIKSCIALTNSIPVSNGAFNFAENNGEQWFLRFGNNENGDIIVVNDCFLVVWNQPDADTSHNIFPSSLTIRTISAKNSDENAEITRHSINLCNESKCSKGVINSDGTIATGNNIVTDIIPISLEQSYNYAEIIKVCCSVNKLFIVDNENRYRYFFGYNAVKIGLYDGNKSFVGILDAANVDVTDGSTIIDVCIDKDFYTYTKDGNNYTIINNSEFVPASQNQKLFDIVKYIRVEFPSGSIEHYVSVANDRNVPEYSIYNEDDLFATSKFVADKIHNSDGAVDNLIKTVLSYLHNSKQLTYLTNTIGYGNIRTAEDQSCEVISDIEFNGARYSGEKMNINCSTFVKLCLEGIKYENSRYELGTDAKNIPTNGYVFDSKAQYQQRNTANSIPVSDYGKMYACLIFKYAEDRGFAYKVDDGYANVEVGDVLFINSDSYANSNSWSYKGVSHTYLVTDVQKLKNGKKVISIAEVKSGTPENPYPVSESKGIVAMESGCNYGARFPLPHINSLSKNVVLEHSDTTVENLTTGTESTLSSVTISKDIAPYGEFTIVAKLKEYNKDVIVKVYTSDGNSKGLVSDNELVRGDGIYIRHFHLQKGDSLSSNRRTLTVKVKNIGDNTISSIELEDVMVFDGYVTM